MNPYKTYSELLFTCVDGPQADVVNAMLAAFNKPDAWNPVESIDFFSRSTLLDFTLAYDMNAERDTTKEHRVIFWEPRIRPGTTAFMGAFHDGMEHSVFRLSEETPFTWLNVRIYDDINYPGSFFDYYANRRHVQRRIMARKDEDGWEFTQKGPVQPFENVEFYSRPRIADRLNRSIITEYMAKLGLNIADDEFWQTDRPASFLWQKRPGEAKGEGNQRGQAR